MNLALSNLFNSTKQSRRNAPGTVSASQHRIRRSRFNVGQINGQLTTFLRTVTSWVQHPINALALANSADLTVDNLRELVRAVAQTDSRFLQKPDGASAVPSSIWVSDLVAPQIAGESWRAIIMAADNKTYEVSFTISSGTVTLSDDSKEVVRVTSYQKLANSADVVDVLGLENALTLDTDGWALLAPFGEHKKERLANVNGAIVRERYVQIVDKEAVDAVIGNEKGSNLFQKIKRALVKRPIYRDHPDLKLYAPETVTAGNEQMIPLGVNDGLRRTDRGMEFRPLLAPDGALAVENDGCKYPSALFLLKKTGVVRDGGWIEVRPFALASVGLTPVPNISGVDSLANAKPNIPAASGGDDASKTKTDQIMKQLLIGWLAAQGVSLANDATDQIVFDAFNKEMGTRAANITALANDKATLDKVTGDKTKLVAGATLPTDLVTAANTIAALGNAQTEATGLRTKYIGAAVDLGITQGRIAVADRANQITALENSKTLDADIEALGKLPVKFQVAGAVMGERKEGAGTNRNAHEQVLSLANNDPRYKDIKDFGEAMKRVLADHPALDAALKQKPEVVAK